MFRWGLAFCIVAAGVGQAKAPIPDPRAGCWRVVQGARFGVPERPNDLRKHTEKNNNILLIK